jgi:hypothetical protein
MPKRSNSPKAEPTQYWTLLRVLEIEKTFMQVILDLQVILVLDGIEVLPELPGFRIRSHDLYGPLPDALIKDTGDRYPVLDEIVREAAKRIAMVRVRDAIVGIFGKCTFLLPTSTGDCARVGMQVQGRMVLAEAISH